MAKVTQLGFIENNSVATPPTGIVYIYAKTDGNMYQLDDNGVETQLTGGGGGSVTNVSSANADLTVANPTSTPVLTVVQTPALRSATTTVNVSSATAPTAGQVLTAISDTAATWQTSSSTGPSFSAYKSADQTINNGVFAQVTFNTEDFDTASCFSSSRFTPNVEGYYNFSGFFLFSIPRDVEIVLYKNGATYSIWVSGTPTNSMSASTLVYMNGSTDYMEVWLQNNDGNSVDIIGGATATRFTGFLARSA